MPIALSDLYPEFTHLLIQTFFFRIYDMYIPEDWGTIAQVVPSTKDSEVYPTLGVVPKTHIFKSERTFQGLGPKQTFQVWNQLYDAGIVFPLTAFQDDQYGIITLRLADLAMEAKRWPTELVYNVIHNGASATINATNDNLGFDGLPLFSANHPGKSATDVQTNTNAEATTLNVAELNTAITAMRRFYDSTGRYLGIMPDTLVVPPELMMPAAQILHSTWLMSVGTSTENTPVTNIPTFNIFDVSAGGVLLSLIVNPYLTSPTEWYVACTTRQAKPVILQQRQAPTLTTKMDPNTSDLVMNTNQGFVSYLARWGAAPGDWHTIFQGST
jgi:phage major head subunit gpT-like protein